MKILPTAILVTTLATLGGGCRLGAGSGVGPFLRSAEVVGHELVTEKCSVRVSDGEVVASDCHMERQRLPVVVEYTAPAGPGATAPVASAAATGCDRSDRRPARR